MTTSKWQQIESTGGLVRRLVARAARLWSQLGLVIGRRMAMIVRDDHIYLIVMAAIVGVTSGLAAALLLGWIEYSNALFPEAADEGWWRWLIVLGVPMLGGLLVGLLRHAARKFLPFDAIDGIHSVIGAITRKRRLSGRSAAVLGLGAGLSIGSGGSVGHEGPTVAIGATVGSVLSRFFGLREQRQVAMTGAGSAAGLAAAFNAPLSGVIFTVEVVFGRSVGGNVGTMSVFTPLIVAAVAGTFTSHAVFGVRSEFDVPISGAESVGEVGFYVLLAVFAGVLSPLMSRTVMGTYDLFGRLGIPAWSKPAIGGLGVGLLGGLVFTDLLGSGRHTVALALGDGLAWELALGLILLKILATALTLGSGGMGGFFMPALFIGACIGTATQALAALLIGDAAGSPGSYAMIGMGAYLGATFRAPVTSIVMIFELTHEYGLILPVMMASILSSFIAARIHPEHLYQLKMRWAGHPLSPPPQELEAEVMRRGRVRDLMIPAADPLRTDTPLSEVKVAAFSRGVRTLYVIDTQRHVCGTIDTTHFAERLLEHRCEDTATAADLLDDGQPTLLYADDSLAGAMVAFARCEYDVLPVVTGEHQLEGYLRHRDLLAYYNEQVLQTREEAVHVGGGGGPGQEVGLGHGMILDRIVVGSRWSGRSLAELALRERASVWVFEWRRGDALLPVDPTQPLRESDVLAMVGTRESLLKVRWLD